MTRRVLAFVAATVCLIAPPAAAQPPPPDPHAGHEMPSSPAPAASPAASGAHTGHESAAPGPAPAPGTPTPRAGHLESAPPPPEVTLPAFVPPVTEAMRAAAFPDVQGHAAHDRAINSFVLFDQLEWRSSRGASGLAWSNTGWVGGDLNRLWFRTEGEGEDGALHEGTAHALYGRAVARWWDAVIGVRQDLRPGAQTWLATGVQGLAPGFFEVELTAYVSDRGQTAAHLEVEYDLLLTNRLILQPLLEVNAYGKTNRSLGVGSGLSAGEAGFRLRYEFRRELAPYVGVTWVKTFGRTRNLARGDGEANGLPRLVAGLRLWF